MSEAAPSAAGESAAAPPSRRRARTWAPLDRPAWSDLRKGGVRRRRWLRYWIARPLRAAFDRTLHRVFGFLPIDLVSRLGGSLGRRISHIGRKHGHARGLANLAALRPDLTPTEVAAAFARNRDNLGRVLAEFSVIERLLPAGRVRVVHRERLDAAAAAGPLLLVGVHVSNWEVIFAVMGASGLPTSLIYQPPTSETKHAIAREVRGRLGIRLLPPGMAGTRPALRVLQAGEVLILFCDEAIDGRSLGPLFGRPPHFEGNLARAVRLARMTGARLVPVHVRREVDCRFVVTFEEPVALADGATLVDDVLRLNAAIEPLVRAGIEQWYYLDSRLDDGARKARKDGR